MSPGMRIPLAFVVAPPAPLLVAWGASFAYLGIADRQVLSGEGFALFLFVAVFGIGYCYVVAALLGIPTYFLLRGVGKLTDRWIIAAGTVVGIIAGWAPQLIDRWPAMAGGALLGTAAGWIFALISRPDRQLPAWPPWAA